MQKLDAFSDKHRSVQARVRRLIGDFYADLKTYWLKTDPRTAATLRSWASGSTASSGAASAPDAGPAIDPAPHQRVGKRHPLLRHTPQGQRRNPSDVGRDCRDGFLGLAKTCDKLGIEVWDYAGSRLKVAGRALVQPLDRYVRRRFRPARPRSPPGLLPLLPLTLSTHSFSLCLARNQSAIS